MYRDSLTEAQIKTLYGLDAPMLALRARAKALGSMTDALSEMASKDAGVPMRYVDGKLLRVR